MGHAALIVALYKNIDINSKVNGRLVQIQLNEMRTLLNVWLRLKVIMHVSSLTLYLTGRICISHASVFKSATVYKSYHAVYTTLINSKMCVFSSLLNLRWYVLLYALFFYVSDKPCIVLHNPGWCQHQHHIRRGYSVHTSCLCVHKVGVW